MRPRCCRVTLEYYYNNMSVRIYYSFDYECVSLTPNHSWCLPDNHDAIDSLYKRFITNRYAGPFQFIDIHIADIEKY